MMTNNKRAVIYCRVSTREQVEEGNSLITQEKACREYAFKSGFDVADVFIEQGESAKTMQRTELKRLIDFCSVRKNNIQAVIAYKIDRVSRNMDDYSQIRILLKRCGVEIKSTSEFFESTPAGRFMENIIANVAQFDNDVRTERSINGMKEAVREGRYVWKGPYGYSNVKVAGKSTIGPDENAISVKKAFEEIAKNYSSIQIVRLNLLKSGYLYKNGKPLCRTQFYNLLQNEIYAGWITQFKERHRGLFEPIVSEELFEQVQRVLKYKGTKGIVKLKHHPDFPLRRFFWHPQYAKLTGCWARGRRKRYAYYFYKTKGLNFRKETTEELFMAFLDSYRLDSKHFRNFERLINENLTKQMSGKQKLREQLQRTVDELKKKQQSIVDKNLSGLISDTTLKGLLEEIERDLLNTNASLMSISDKNINFTAVFKNAKEYLNNPSKMWNRAPVNIKVLLQWFYFPEGIIFDGKVCRTTDICSIFKAKDLFFASTSTKAPFPNKNKNTPEIVISPHVPNEPYVDDLFWNKIGNELVYLNEITREE